jgi:hypothetical protein
MQPLEHLINDMHPLEHLVNHMHALEHLVNTITRSLQESESHPSAPTTEDVRKLLTHVC